MSMDLQKELLQLRRQILSMGASVETRVSEAIDALLKGDIDEAIDVRTGDDEIDAMDLDIEAECLRILALAHPVAGDLRFIFSVIRINNDLERIADLAKSIAKRVIALQEYDHTIDIPEGLSMMANNTRRMLSDAVAALANEDDALCNHIRRADDQIDDLLKEMFTWAQTNIPQHVEATGPTIDLLSIARKLERIADMTTNIAEDVIFIIAGDVVRHSKAQR